MGFQGYDNLTVDTDVMYGDQAGSSPAEYYVGRSPAFQCPSGAREIGTKEQCLVHYREDNLMPPREGKRTPPCYRCSTGAAVRAAFAEED